MKATSILCLLFALSVSAHEFTNCGEKNPHFYPTQLDVSPSPVIYGENFNLTVTLYNDHTIKPYKYGIIGILVNQQNALRPYGFQIPIDWFEYCNVTNCADKNTTTVLTIETDQRDYAIIGRPSTIYIEDLDENPLMCLEMLINAKPPY